MLVMAAGLLYGIYLDRLSDFEATQKQLAANAVESTRVELQHYIENQRHLAQLFAKVEAEALTEMVTGSDDPALHRHIDKAVQYYLPQAANITVADDNGSPLLPDPDKRVGKGCRIDLKQYAQGNKQNTIFVHSNPELDGYHFDVMADVEAEDGFSGIFFASINTLVLSRLLTHRQLPGHELMLLRADKGALIDLTRTGPRPALSRDHDLSADELDRVLASREVPGTRWRIVDLPDPKLFSDQRNFLARQGLIAWLVFAFVSLALLIWLRSEEKRRHDAEKALLDARDQLQIRVDKRTEELRNSRDALYHEATHDNLTGLINRPEFERRLSDLITQVRDGQPPGALVYLDLDQFKLVNDSCGHLAGDRLLRDIARRIEEFLRESDSVGRLGGDEFGLLLNRCQLEKATAITQSLIDLVRTTPFNWEDKSFNIGLSAGVVQINANTTSNIDALRNADLACYVAKDLGRNRWHTYSIDDSESSRRSRELGWLSNLPQVIRDNRFCLYGQAIVPLNPRAGDPHRFELLIRMRAEDGSLVPPGEFIAAAEHYNLIGQIDRWVISNAFRHMMEFEDSCGTVPISLSLNLSGSAMTDHTLIDFITGNQRSYNIDPRRITFEITETRAIADMSDAHQFITGLKARGFRFAMDDFGTGVSSFSYLRNLPVDVLKIDGSFIRNLPDDAPNQAIVRSIAESAKAMNMVTVAEFVEDPGMMPLLKELGVDYAQGFGIGLPQPLEEITDTLIASAREQSA